MPARCWPFSATRLLPMPLCKTRANAIHRDRSSQQRAIFIRLARRCIVLERVRLECTEHRDRGESGTSSPACLALA